MKIQLCLSECKTDVDGLSAIACNSIDIGFPSTLSKSQLGKIGKDGQLLHRVFTESGEAVNEVLQKMSKGDTDGAAALLNDIGITEKSFADEGGGLLLAIAIGAAILLYPQIAH